MSQEDQIVNIQVQLQASAVPQPSFSIPMILGISHRMGSDKIRYYTEPDGMLTDGFLTSDPEYKHAVAAFSQAIRPVQIAVGDRSAEVAQIDTITPTPVDLHDYKIKINGVEYSFTAGSSTTAALIVAGLLALINADSACPATATGSTTLILTAKVAGVGFTTDLESDTNLAIVHTTANHGVVDDLVAIQLASDLWYGLDLCSTADHDILSAASWIETQKKIFIGSTKDTDVPTSVTTDLASKLKGLSYTRSALLYTLLQANLDAGIAAAWLGGQLPAVPGSSTWKFKQLVGITPDVYNATQRNYLIGLPGTPQKNANIYETVGGVNITEEGWMAGGQFIDVTVGMDWFTSVAQANIYTLLVQNPKIPFTDEGGAVIQNALIQAIKQGINNGLIDGKTAYSVIVPDVLSIPTSDRANRILSGVTFSFRLAGAFHFIKVKGTVTV